MKKSLGAKTIGLLALPAPGFIVGTDDKNGKPNAMAVSWGGVCCSDPPCVSIALREATYTYANLMERKAFTISIVSEKYLKEAHYFGTASGRKQDKFSSAMLTPVKSELVDAPYVKEFPLVLECSLIQSFKIGLHTLFIGLIKDVKADEKVLTKERLPDIKKIKPIIYNPANLSYYGLGKYLRRNSFRREDYSIRKIMHKLRLGFHKREKYLLFLVLFLAAVLSGCALKPAALRNTPAAGSKLSHTGTLQDPIIDSDMSLADALRKEAPAEFKARQRLVDVLYYSFDGKIHKGQLVIDERLAGDIREVFRVALACKFPIFSVIPISDDRFFKNGKWNEDDLSMLSNNTSAFNYRRVTGGRALSNHAYGFAIDINPVQNPYIKGKTVLPPNAVYDTLKPGTLSFDSPVVKTFTRLGWAWGGRWESLKDYQHFEKVLHDKSIKDKA